MKHRVSSLILKTKTKMKKVFFALALVATVMVGCNGNVATSTETGVDSTAVQVDSVSVDSVAVDTVTVGLVK
jgi:outer membrane lipoprotein SlyB